MPISAPRACNRPIWRTPSLRVSRRRAPCSWTAHLGSEDAKSVHAGVRKGNCSIVYLEACPALIGLPLELPRSIDEMLSLFLEVALFQNQVKSIRSLFPPVLYEKRPSR